MQFPNNDIERARSRKFDFIAGCDEVGMGPLAGPVVAAICIFHKSEHRTKIKQSLSRVRDSKTVSKDERVSLAKVIRTECSAYGIGKSSVAEIDRLNIHQARFLAMRRAWKDLLKRFPGVDPKRSLIVIDGLFPVSDLDVAQETYVKGDRNIFSIAAASILAKEHYDRLMKRLHKRFPEYGFDSHQGYGTEKHRAAISAHGSTAEHRRSFIRSIE